jgi:hypothetical protein
MKGTSLMGKTMCGIFLRRMKMKKFIIICALGVLSLFAVGCTKTIDLTDEENELVAEYAAELLLKYGTDIDFKYYYDDDSDTDITTTELSETTSEVTTEVTSELTTTETASETGTEARATERVSSTDNNGTVSDGQDGDTSMTDITEEDTETIESSDYNLAEFFEEDDVSIKYSYNMLLDSYPSYDQDGVYMEIQAPEGYKLLVLKFDIENTTNESRDIDLYDKDIDYRIIVDDSKAAKQMLTILVDDLYTYQKTMEPSMFEEDVLLFQVSDEVAAAMQDLKLEVTYKGKQVILQLQ